MTPITYTRQAGATLCCMRVRPHVRWCRSTVPAVLLLRVRSLSPSPLPAQRVVEKCCEQAGMVSSPATAVVVPYRVFLTALAAIAFRCFADAASVGSDVATGDGSSIDPCTQVLSLLQTLDASGGKAKVNAHMRSGAVVGPFSLQPIRD